MEDKILKNGLSFKTDKPKTKNSLMRISGYASTIEKDSDGDVIVPSAYAETMESYMKHPMLLFMHNWYDKPIGKVVNWEIDNYGLWVEADILNTTEGSDVAKLIEAELLDSFSVGFGNAVRDDDDASKIVGLKLYEISVVNLGANPQSLFELQKQAKEKGINLKSFNTSQEGGDATKRGKTKMGLDQKALDTIAKCEAMVGDFESSIDSVSSEVTELSANITKQAKLLKQVGDQQEKLQQGLITQEDFDNFAKKIGEDILAVQQDIQVAKKAIKIKGNRDSFSTWKEKAHDINFVNNDMGQPLASIHQKAYHLFYAPVNYEGNEGQELKQLRDLHDAVYLADAYLSKRAKGQYNIVNLKSYKLFKELLENYDPEFAKAMYSTGTGVGDEWVPTEMSAELYEAYELAKNVESYIPHWDMPSNPAIYPILSSRPTMYRASEVAVNNPNELIKSNVGTGNITFTTETFGIAVPVSPEFIEDSIIAVVPLVREQIAKGMVDGYESLIINGDSSTTHMDTATACPWAGDSTRPESYEKGLRYFAINNSKAYDVQTGSTDFAASDLRKIRSLLPNAYGHKAGDLVYVTTLPTWIKMLSFSEMSQFGTYGANASWKTGDLPAFDGSPVVLTDNMVNTYHTDGKWTANDTTNVHSAVICFNKNAFKVGQRRGVTVEFEKNVRTQQWTFTGTMRKSFKSMDASGSEAVALAINIEQ